MTTLPGMTPSQIAAYKAAKPYTLDQTPFGKPSDKVETFVLVRNAQNEEMPSTSSQVKGSDRVQINGSWKTVAQLEAGTKIETQLSVTKTENRAVRLADLGAERIPVITAEGTGVGRTRDSLRPDDQVYVLGQGRGLTPVKDVGPKDLVGVTVVLEPTISKGQPLTVVALDNPLRMNFFDTLPTSI